MQTAFFACALIFIAHMAFSADASAQQRDRDWTACTNSSDSTRQIAGCTAVLARGNLESVSNRATAHANRGNAHYYQDNYGAAILDFNEVIRLTPRNASAFFSRGNVHWTRGHLDAAAADFTEAIRIGLRDANLFMSRGLVYSESGKLDAAIADMDESIRLAPTVAMSFNDRAFTKSEMGDLRGALRDIETAIAQEPSNPLFLSNRGHMRLTAGDLRGALADFDAITQIAADVAWGHLGRAEVSLTQGHNAEAADAAERGRQLIANSTRPFDVVLHARALWLLGKGRDAIALLDGYLFARFGSITPLIYRGDANLSIGDLEAALRDFNAVLQIAPGNLHALTGRARVLERRGDRDGALESLRRSAAGGHSVAARDLVRLSVVTPPREASPPPTAAPPAAERRVALVIGNAAYRAPGVAPLPNPPRDARAMAALFRDLGFAHVALHQDLDQAAMLRALRDFEREAEQADWAVVYFAGHGIEINGANHLVPIDAQLRSDRDVPDEAVPLSRVLSRLEGTRKLRLVILDACRDNPFLPRMQRVATRSITRGLAPIEDAQMQAGTMVAFAARAGQLAEDGTADNSPFVEALNRRMREPNVEINLLFRRVRDDVLSATGRRQEPFTYASLPGEELFLRR